MANLITSLRIAFSIAILFFPALSPAFYVLYFGAGVTDMIDGTIARKTNTVSAFGSKLDTVADFIMVVVCLIKLCPVLNFEIWMLIWIGIIAIIKIMNIVNGLVIYKKYVTVHSIMNKVAGGVLFILPLTLQIIDFSYSAAISCTVAMIAALQEGYYIRTRKIEK